MDFLMRRFCIFLAILMTLFTVSCGSQSEKKSAVSDGKIHVFVSILPQKYFVEKIGGDYVTVEALVGPGQSPHTFEPSPQQMTALSSADVFFRIGFPFEVSWLDKISQVNPKMKIVDTREGITLLPMTSHHHESDQDHQDEGSMDPHIWLSPNLVKLQAHTIYDSLSKLDPQHNDYFYYNLQTFFNDLDSLRSEIRESFKNLKTSKFMVFHPSWGYFADEFGLEMIPIEIEGKEPNAKDLAEIIDLAKRENISVIFVQTQFSQKSAESIAEKIGAKVVAIDPLAENYMENMRHIAQVLSSELK